MQTLLDYNYFMLSVELQGFTGTKHDYALGAGLTFNIALPARQLFLAQLN